MTRDLLQRLINNSRQRVALYTRADILQAYKLAATVPRVKISTPHPFTGAVTVTLDTGH